MFDDSAKTLVFTEESKENSGSTEYQNIDFSTLHKGMMNKLYKRNIHSVIIEGGRETLQSFIDANLWDEARVFVCAINLKKGISAPIFNVKQKSEERISTDVLRWYHNSSLVS